MSWVRTERIGDLEVRITGGTDGRGGGDGPLVVLLHGFGAPGEDLVALHQLIDVPRAVRFAFPAAPIAMPGLYAPGRAWWMLDLERLQRDLSSPDPAERALARAAEIPDGMAPAHAAVVRTLDGLRDALTVGDAPVVLGGFSQGAMLACDIALCSDQSLTGVVLMSATLLAADRWRAGAAAHAGLPVFQSHGEADPLLPMEAAAALRDLLSGAGLPLTWHPFAGGHEIPPSVLDEMSRFLHQAFHKVS